MILEMAGLLSWEENTFHWKDIFIKRSPECSPLSPEVSKRHAEASNRKERGIYITDGVKFNADAVGAFNTLRKYLSVSGKQKKLSVTGLKTPEIIKVAA